MKREDAMADLIVFSCPGKTHRIFLAKNLPKLSGLWQIVIVNVRNRLI
jgi:hypothetical protein